MKFLHDCIKKIESVINNFHFCLVCFYFIIFLFIDQNSFEVGKKAKSFIVFCLFWSSSDLDHIQPKLTWY